MSIGSGDGSDRACGRPGPQRGSAVRSRGRSLVPSGRRHAPYEPGRTLGPAPVVRRARRDHDFAGMRLWPAGTGREVSTLSGELRRNAATRSTNPGHSCPTFHTRMQEPHCQVGCPHFVLEPCDRSAGAATLCSMLLKQIRRRGTQHDLLSIPHCRQTGGAERGGVSDLRLGPLKPWGSSCSPLSAYKCVYGERRLKPNAGWPSSALTPRCLDASDDGLRA